MRRSASEVIRNLEQRIARLERQSARMTPKHFLEMMERKHENYFLGLDLRDQYTKELLNFAKERMVKGSQKDKEKFILNIETLAAFLRQESMVMDLEGAIEEVVFYMGMNGVSLRNLEYTWKVGLTNKSDLQKEWKKGDNAKREEESF